MSVDKMLACAGIQLFLIAPRAGCTSKIDLLY